MAKGTKVDSLFVGLGMDLSQLDADMALADKTVSQGIAALNREKNRIKLQADIDTNKLDAAKDATQRLAVAEQSLTKQVDLQRQKMLLMSAAYKDTSTAKGAESDAAQRMQINLLKEEKEYTRLQSELKKLNAERGKPQPGNSAAGLDKIKTGVSNITTSYTKLAAAATTAFLAMKTGQGLFNITKEAMDSGEATYKLQQKLHTTAAEASQLNMTFKLAGADVNSLIPLMAKLDKTVLSAGKSGNATTDAMAKFGVKLTDDLGALLPLNQQIERLAIGYDNAAKTGETESYAAEILGGRGAALIPVLEQYNDLMEVSARVKKTGLLDPKAAHELTIEWKVMQAEANNLETALGAALMPVAADIVPQIEAAFESMIGLISENKKEITGMAEALGSLASMAGSFAANVNGALKYVGADVASVSEHAKGFEWLSDKHPIAATFQALGPFAGPVNDSLFGDEYEQYKKEQEEKAEEAKAAAVAETERRKAELEEARAASMAKAAEAQKERENYKLNEQAAAAEYHNSHTRLENEIFDIKQKTQESIKNGADEATAWKLAEAEIAAANKKAADEIEQTNGEIKDSIFELTSTTTDSQLHNIDKQSEAWRKKGADEELIARQSEAAKAKVYEDFENNVVAKVDSVWKTELENRLDDIDREKQAWEKKGLDEVKATEWSEHEKQRVMRESALDVLKSQREQWNVYKAAMAGQISGFDGKSSKVYDFSGSMADRMERAKLAMLQYLRGKDGITADDYMTPDMLQQYQKVMQYAKNNEVPGMESDLSAKMAPQMGGSGPMRYQDGGKYQININIDQPLLTDDQSTDVLVDKVSDRLTAVIENVTGGSENGY